MDGFENSPKVDSVADHVVKVADLGIELKEQESSASESNLPVPVDQSSPTAASAPPVASALNLAASMGSDGISRTPQYYFGAKSLTATEITWPQTRSRQVLNLIYFGACGLFFGLPFATYQGPLFSIGAFLCFAMAAASAFYLIRHRAHVSCNDELPVWARRSLRSIALIFPALLVGASLWIMPPQPSQSSLTPPPVLSAQPSDLATELALADKLYDEEDYVGAATHYNNVVKIDPKNEHSYDRLADSYLRFPAYENEKAIANADQALKLNPHNASAGSSKAWALNSLHRHAEALVIATAAAKDDPTYGEAFAGIAEAQRGLHNYAAALKADNEHVRLHDYEGQSYRDRAETLDALGRHDEAKADLERARKADAKEDSGN